MSLGYADLLDPGQHGERNNSLSAAAIRLFARYDSLRLRMYQERECHGDRIKISSIGSATALRFDEVGYFNRTYSPDQSVSESLPEIETFYSGGGFAGELIGPPEGADGEMNRSCRTRGWVPGRRYAWLHAPLPMAMAPRHPNEFSIRDVLAEERESFLLSYLRAFEARPERFAHALRNMRHLFGVTDLLCLMAWQGKQPSGVGVLYRAGKVAGLCAGATLPEYRRRGCHAALLTARIRLAEEQGCDEVFAWAIAGGQGHTNMERIGLKTVGITTAWRAPANGGVARRQHARP
jgi:GNAT superfamily N-acetyltransferase